MMQLKFPRTPDEYSLNLTSYGWDKQYCYYFQIDHKHGGDLTIDRIFDYYLKKQHWDKWIQPGMTVIDIGGHAGDTAIPMMARCRSTVLTVEPNPHVLPYLAFNCGVNQHLGKFVIATEAVTDKVGNDFIFGDHRNGMCNGGILNEKWDDATANKIAGMTENCINVAGMPLEAMCEKYLTPEEINNIGFVKTDTEGHDIEIIRSSRKFLQRHKPVLFTEWFFAYSEKDTAELFKVINDAGYQAFYPETMQPADPSIRSDDLVCIHRDNL
jgi:FkbM family methyltransferase